MQVAGLLQYECLIRQQCDFVLYACSYWQPVQFRKDRRDVVPLSRVGDGASETILETLKLGKIRLRRLVENRVAIV